MQGFWNLIGKAGEGPGKDFQYDVGEKASSSLDSKSVWTLYHGKKRTNGEIVTIFICDGKTSSPDELQLAKTGHKRLKTLRHPNIIKYLDGFESENLVYVVTEPVTPLLNFLDEEDGRNANLLTWGLYQVVKGLSFLVNDGNLLHENINIFSIFVGLDGEWKLGGVEFVHTAETDVVAKLPYLSRYDPPEGNTSKKGEKWSSDAWGLGCLIWEIYNGVLQKSSDLKTVSKIPKQLLMHYCDLVHANPRKRTNPKDVLGKCLQPGHFFDNDFIKANLFLSEIQIKDSDQQKDFFQSLDKSIDSFPKQFCVHKVLPQLLNAFDFGAAGSAVLSPLFKVGLLLDSASYQAKIVPCIIKLFSSNDRATRIQLLQQLDKFVKHLQPAVVDNQIFACVATGFGDTLPAMREQTVKAMLHLVPKLSSKTINNQLLRFFAKLQTDEQPGIRTNTTICLGKIAEYIPEDTRKKILAPGFIRAIHDPFPHARNAGIMAMAATQKYYNPTDIATRLLPALCAITVDQDKSVRENALKVIKSFISIMEKYSNDPESVVIAETKQEEQGSTWTGWAVSSFTSRFYQGQNPDSGAKKAEEKSDVVDGAEKEKSDATTNIATPQTPQNEVPQETNASSNVKETFNENKGNRTSDIRKESNNHKSKSSTNKTKVSSSKSDHDSDSDYGDWGGEDGDGGWGKTDEWGSFNDEAVVAPVVPASKSKEDNDVSNKSLNEWGQNDEWGSLDEPSPSSKIEPAPIVQEKVENEWGKSEDWNQTDAWSSFDKEETVPSKPVKLPNENKSKDLDKFAVQPFDDSPKLASTLFQGNAMSDFDSFTPSPEQSTQNETLKSDENVQSSEWETKTDDWGLVDWKDEDSSKEIPEKKDNSKEKRKEELQRRREEQRLKREAQNKEKRAKSGTGGMKLGGVKKSTLS